MINTGNGVGKTTVLRLIDYCFGKDAKKIYTDPESGETLGDVKAYLIEKRVLIRLTLSERADKIEPNSKYVIERNFLSGKHKIQMINGERVSRAKEFPQKIGRTSLESYQVISQRLDKSPAERFELIHQLLIIH